MLFNVLVMICNIWLHSLELLRLYRADHALKRGVGESCPSGLPCIALKF